MKINQTLHRKALAKVQKAASEIERQLTGGSLETKRYELRQLLDRDLGEDEYFVLVTRDGLGVLHTNRLREGILFNDPVGLKAAQTDKPLTQIYPRNTGEILLDASVPVRVNGKLEYSLRLGTVVPSRSFAWKVQAAAMVPVLTATAGFWLFESNTARGAVAFASIVIAFLAGQSAFGVFKTNWRDWIMVTKSISSGKLQARIQTGRRDELGQMSFEINKMAIGMHGILSELQNTSASTKEISLKQEEMVQELLGASQQLSAGLQQVHGGSVEQTELVKETEDVLINIASRLRQAGAELSSVSQITQEAEQAARQGMEKTGHLQTQMQRIQAASHSTETSMIELENQASGIEQMIRDIREIAEQTNLLALNAAIEAARAGSEGRGFAVVAEEVRKLANRADEAASHIMNLAQNIIQQSHHTLDVVQEERKEVRLGLSLVEDVQMIIQSLTEKSSGAASHTARNSHAMSDILQDVDSVEQRIEQVRQISQAFHVSAEEAAAAGDVQYNATEQVADQTKRLREISDKILHISERFEL